MKKNIVLSILLVLLLVGCSQDTGKITYHNIEQVDKDYVQIEVKKGNKILTNQIRLRYEGDQAKWDLSSDADPQVKSYFRDKNEKVDQNLWLFDLMGAGDFIFIQSTNKNGIDEDWLYLNLEDNKVCARSNNNNNNENCLGKLNIKK
ncbi:hypothetical protein ERUR111494_05135 [Erysipelothrix urinaevulpis]|uniref:hypothetical protein n=1 Tax=Erysipelothrix urinaevulpis TaxID=2683717 RepID=UPI00135A6246|nr:hypothetical protein [Erysipelothrix urinaevulpis]